MLDPAQEQGASKVSYKRLPQNFSVRNLEIVEDPGVADLFVVPNPFVRLGAEERAELVRAHDAARAHGKRVLAFLKGDYSYREHFVLPGLVLLKGSAYARDLRDNEVVFAPFVSDLSDEMPLSIREKGEKAVVGFCGFAGYPNIRSKIKSLVLHAVIDALAVVEPRLAALKRGVYWRARALRALAESDKVTARLIVRTSFSGNATTVRGNPAAVRTEYLENIRDADYVLAPKGDANYSSRFYEVLSLGRIPVLVDTDVVLPMERTIDYSRFCVKVPYKDVDRIADVIADFHTNLTPEAFRTMQEAAREAYETLLRYDRYFERALPLLADGGAAAVR